MNMALQDCYHSLVTIKTRDEQARRKSEDDEDMLFGSSLSPFAMDIHLKLLLSKCLRRLADKTQVSTANPNRHVRTRLSHTLEVVSIACCIANELGLNVDLCQAAAFGHDIGHTPFGHLGEEFLKKKTGKEFRHEVFGLVVAQHIERKGRGLNLTHQVLDAILRHSRGSGEMCRDGGTEEAAVVMYADKIGYVWADVNDFFRMHVDTRKYPELFELVEWFGPNQRARVQKCITALCLESAEQGRVSFERSETAINFRRVKQLMYDVYQLFNFSELELLERAYEVIKENTRVDSAIVFALMSDHDILSIGRSPSYDGLAMLSISEILPYLEEKAIDFTNPDLNW